MGFIRELLETLQRMPILWVMGAGMLFGTAATQAVKKGWLAFGNTARISEPRFVYSVRMLSCGTTYLFTLGLWHNQIGHDGLEEWVCAGWGIASPMVYDGLRAAVSWKFPEFAAHWGAPENVPFKPPGDQSNEHA